MKRASDLPAPAFAAGRDPESLKPQTGQRKLAAAEMPYVKLALIGTTERVPRRLGDSDGVWPMTLTITSNIGAELRAARRRSLHALDVHAEPWTDAAREVADLIKEKFDAALSAAGKTLSETSAMFDCEPAEAVALLEQLVQESGINVFDNKAFDDKVDARARERVRTRYMVRR